MAEVNEKHLNEIIDNIVENRVNEVHDKNNLLTALLINMNENLYSAIKESVANEIQKQFNNQNIHANQNSSQIIHLNNNTLDANILTPSKVDNDNSASDQSLKSFAFLANRGKYIIAALLFVLILIILAAVYGHLQTDDKSKLSFGTYEDTRINIPVNSTIGQDNIEGGNVLRIVARDAWLAQPPVSPLVPLDLPVRKVIIVPTYTSDCDAQSKCTYRVRLTQTFNIESQQNDDIVYNFLIGGDGNVYEGRGWSHKAAAIKGYNDDSITVAFIGTFHDPLPSKVLNVTKLFLAQALRLKKLTTDYKIIGANQLDKAFASGTGLYKSFETWPHWSDIEA